MGGLSARDLAGDIKGAYEVMRRGETEPEIIIPPKGQPVRKADDPERKVYQIDADGNDIIPPPPDARSRRSE